MHFSWNAALMSLVLAAAGAGIAPAQTVDGGALGPGGGSGTLEGLPWQPIEDLRTQIMPGSYGGVVWCGSPPADRTRLYVLSGGLLRLIRITRPGGDAAPPVYTALPNAAAAVNGEVRSAAFAPDYAVSGHVYIAVNGQIDRFQRSPVDPDVFLAPPTRIINLGTGGQHGTGSIHFGRDGMLYIGAGNSAGDPQNPRQLGGKMLRIDVTRDDFPSDPQRNYGIPADNPFPISTATNAPRPEIWHVGMRNPWRWSFDRATGDAWLADVGDTYEGTDIIRALAGGLGGGGAVGTLGLPLLNFGYPRYDADVLRNPSTPLLAGTRLHKPNIVFPRSDPHRDGRVRGFNGASNAGGVVYRGTAIPTLRGRYITADTVNNWALAFSAAMPYAAPINLTTQLARTTTGQTQPLNFVVALCEDADGEVYICEYGSGRIRKIVPAPLPPPPPLRAIHGDEPLDGLDHDQEETGRQ
ncbi:MAG TPA: PQQ-dependent sugar dehydrogenase [Phycisphaerales bacterium]|nr:PQQ-dependent sugar dehydrogenase [Phycisphaerales bacterium]